MEFTFKLTEAEAQKVLDALIKEPYITVVDVVNKIQEQASEQRQKNDGGH
ncbi:hypothetical protein ACFYKT_16720 [Cytobacillus sp. FJAT-53684]|uniref:Uncharacterized protein n=1 Tax=Cytobacillus mangrovibacter TaxID=3299024 RepID=A0ABW6K324_9BACI